MTDQPPAVVYNSYWDLTHDPTVTWEAGMRAFVAADSPEEGYYTYDGESWVREQ